MWNERYREPGFLFGTEPAAFLEDQQAYLVRGQKALSIADGEGRNSVFMAQKGVVVTAQDASEIAIDKARGLASAREARVDFQHADLREWDWSENQYDLVVAIFIQFADTEFREEIFAGMKNTLKPGGILMLHGYTPKQIEYGTGGPPSSKNMYTKEMLRGSFSDMETLRLEVYDRNINEGRGHSGKSALIDLIARKA